MYVPTVLPLRPASPTRRAVNSEMASALCTVRQSRHIAERRLDIFVSAARRATLSDPTTPLVALSTAHPAKFPEAVKAASGVTAAVPPGAADLAGKPERFDRLPADGEAVMAYIRDFAKA